MQPPLVSKFEDPREFLLAYLDYLKSENKDFSLRRWAQQLGFNHHGYLANVIRGQRTMTVNLAKKIAKVHSLSRREAKNLELLCLYHASKNIAAKEQLGQLLERTNPTLNLQNLETSRFRLIRDWYYFPILELLNLKDFKEDPQWISKRLNNKVSPLQIDLALDRLMKLGLIMRDSNNRLRRSEKDIFVGNEQAQDSIVEHHEQFIKKALESLKTQDIKERDISGTNVAIHKSDFIKLKEYIRDFQEKIHSLATTSADEVYHVNIQAFKLTNELENYL